MGRVLITTRQGELGRVGYETRGSVVHRQLMLTGLGTVDYPDDAIDLCKALWAVPSMPGEMVQPMPGRSALVSVLEQVAFHPLSIKLVVEQLKVQRVAAVGQALERLLAAVPKGQSKERCLTASLNLSLERLGTEEREWVKQLGVFQGGAMEDVLLQVTGLGHISQNNFSKEKSNLSQYLDFHDLLRGKIDLQDTIARPIKLERVEGISWTHKLFRQSKMKHISTEPFSNSINKPGDESEIESLESLTENDWLKLRHKLDNAGLINIEIIPNHPVSYLRFHPVLASTLWKDLGKSQKESLIKKHKGTSNNHLIKVL